MESISIELNLSQAENGKKERRKMKKEIFKAYDIRGIYPDDINEDDVKKIARGFATYLINKNPDKESLTVVVGRDMRISSSSLAKKAIEGLVESGINVVDIGLVSSPTFYFAVGEKEYDGGLQISASHNPKEYNGIKIVRGDRKSTRLNSSHIPLSRMPSSA